MQVHYKRPLDSEDNSGVMLTYTEAKPKYNAGIFLMLRSQLTIKPGVKNVHGDMNCEVKDKMTMFAFRTHAHTLGAVITGFRVRDGEFEEIARGDPQRPQTFYPMPKFQVAKKGDIMVARCTFDGTRTNKTTRIGKFLAMFLVSLAISKEYNSMGAPLMHNLDLCRNDGR